MSLSRIISKVYIGLARLQDRMLKKGVDFANFPVEGDSDYSSQHGGRYMPSLYGGG